MRWRRENSFPVSPAPERICRRLSRFCNILLQDLTPLYVKITRSENLLSVCQRKLKLSTYLHIVSYNHISFVTRRYQLGWVLALSSQRRIQGRGPGGRPHPPPPLIFRPNWGPKGRKQFFERPPAHPLFSRFGSGSGSGFYSITWRTAARSAGYKIYFRKKTSIQRWLFSLSVRYLSFLWIHTSWLFVHGSRLFIQSNK